MGKLKEGDKAPAFTSKDQNGNDVSLKGLKGKKVVLYFYPKDNTPGCTKQACNLRDHYTELQSAGYEVLGVSMDSEAKHQKFIAKYDLPFSLLVDDQKVLLEKYEAWGKKKFMGKEYMGILRKTFVIDEDGNIEKIIEKVKTNDHTAQILN